MVRIEIIKKHLGNYPGSVIHVSEESAAHLISLGCGRLESVVPFEESQPKPKRRRRKKELTEDPNSDGPPEDEPTVATYKKWTTPDAK